MIFWFFFLTILWNVANLFFLVFFFFVLFCSSSPQVIHPSVVCSWSCGRALQGAKVQLVLKREHYEIFGASPKVCQFKTSSSELWGEEYAKYTTDNANPGWARRKRITAIYVHAVECCKNSFSPRRRKHKVWAILCQFTDWRGKAPCFLLWEKKHSSSSSSSSSLTGDQVSPPDTKA